MRDPLFQTSGTKKVVINRCYGGFGLSVEALRFIAAKKNEPIFFYYSDYDRPKSQKNVKITDEMTKKRAFLYVLGEDLGDFCSDAKLNKAKWVRYDDREDADLIEAVLTLGEAANGECAKLEVVEIPIDVDYVIEEYDGVERIAEAHRTWY